MAIIQTDHYEINVDESYDRINDFIDKLEPSKIFVIVDNNTETHCLPLLKEKLHLDFISIRIPPGEKYKTINTCQALWQALIENHCDRNCLVINLGGGVIGDMGGFVAGTYMRGINFIQVPTTLLSQVDASVGGKLGVDHMGYKNMIGMFSNPSYVWIHTPFLETLHEREVLSGFAEVIKHALISSKRMWDRIKVNGIGLSEEDWTQVVSQSVKIKQNVVSEDPKEKGIRKILNFGHTVGHAIESYFLKTNNPLRHGEAVAKGMIAEAFLAFKTKRITIIEMEEINSLLESIYDLPAIPKEDTEKIIALMSMDKKNKGGDIRFSLLNGIGSCDYDVSVEMDIIRQSLSF